VLLLGAGLLGLALLVLLAGTRGSSAPGAPAEPPDQAQRRAETPRPARAAPPIPSAQPAPAQGPSAIAAALDSDPSSPEVPSLPPAQPPYAPETLALAEELHPGVTEPTDAPGSKDGSWRLRFLPTPYVVRAPAPIAVTLELLDATGARHAIPRAELTLKTANPKRANPPLYTVPFVDDGSGSDGAGDLLYTATFMPPSDARAGLFGHVLMQIQVQLPDGSHQLLTGALEYSPEPNARIAGQFEDSVRDGHLYLTMTVRVSAQGLYRVAGQLFGPHLEPIAESYALETLSPGDARVSLRFFGKALVDKGVDGPYRVRQLYLSEEIVDEAYSAMGPVIEEAWTTRPYRVTQFSAEPYQQPVATGPRIGPDDPSQVNKPPPLMKRPEPSRSSGSPGSSTPPPAGAPGSNPTGPK
jgi:hypothetical protein